MDAGRRHETLGSYTEHSLMPQPAVWAPASLCWFRMAPSPVEATWEAPSWWMLCTQKVCVTAEEHWTWKVCHFYSKQTAISLGGMLPHSSGSVTANTLLLSSWGKERSEPRILGTLSGNVQCPSGPRHAASPNNLYTRTRPRNWLEDGNSKARVSLCKCGSLL